MKKQAAAPKQGHAKGPAYKNSSLPSARRAKDLLSRMTLQEKAAQMLCIWQQKSQTLVDADGNFDAKKAKAAFRNRRGLGQVGRPSDAGKGLNARKMATLTNAIQKFFVENSRLGIPVIFHEECLHGHAAVDGTSFPQPIALGATFNPELVEAAVHHDGRRGPLSRSASGAYTGSRRGARAALGPRGRNIRRRSVSGFAAWASPRCADSRAIAPSRTSAIVIATLKHFVGHGQPESGMNCAPANVSLRVLRETFLSTFREALREAGAISVMASYNEIDGVPSHANRWLLRDVLRKEWGFKGFVVSDYYAIWELGYRPDTHGHHVAADKKESCALAVKAGVNIELPDPDCYLHLVELVRKGVLKESRTRRAGCAHAFLEIRDGPVRRSLCRSR